MKIPPFQNMPPRSSIPAPSRRSMPRSPAAHMTVECLEFLAAAGVSRPLHAVCETESQRSIEIRMLGRGDPAFTEPLVQVIAANLAAGGMAPGRFAVEMAALSRHLVAASGPQPEPIYQALAIAILSRRDPQGNVRTCDIARMDTVYALMCRRRWWITIAQDLPLAALLAGVNAPAEHIDQDCERTYAGLIAQGYAVGLSSQIAACVLCLAPIAQEHSFRRFVDLAQAFRHAATLHQPSPAELSMLCLLDQDPERIASRYRDILAGQDSPTAGRPCATSDSMQAIGRTFLECLATDRSLGGMSARTGRGQQQQLVRDFLACTCVVAMATMDAQAISAA